ncbi:alpha/beta hydrolase [Ilumatobacter sp.]|uniref:alpha/beta hydrolase n=1 Tax=Ilumatobacter sp. TaxID=1967498 RepID=UPI003B51E5F2
MNIIGEMAEQTTDWLRGHRERDLPPVSWTPGLAAKWLIDEATLQNEAAITRMRLPTSVFRRRLRDELGEGVDLFDDKGWTADPMSYHRDPPELRRPRLARRSALGLDYEHLVVRSGYEPHPEEPGRDRWLGYEDNREAHAWVLRHPGGPRPWLICVNGYRTGTPAVDFTTFGARRLHHEYGLNLAFPVSPLHGPRAEDRSGDRVLSGGAMNTVHTAAQGIWDIRRLKSWIDSTQEPTAVGMSGISLGGYFTSLLTCFEDDLACVIAGVPEPDLVRGQRRNVDRFLPPFYEQWGLSWRSLTRLNRVVSPLHMDPVVPWEKRYIFGGLVDRWVRPGNVKALWQHWDEPSICWYDGSHLSFPWEPDVRSFVRGALAEHLDVRAAVVV